LSPSCPPNTELNNKPSDNKAIMGTNRGDMTVSVITNECSLSRMLNNSQNISIGGGRFYQVQGHATITENNDYSTKNYYSNGKHLKFSCIMILTHRRERCKAEASRGIEIY
jgi:hypothetical protein